MGWITIWENDDFQGEGRNVSASETNLSNMPNGDLGNWNDRISSIKVHSGKWAFYEHADYQGKSIVLTQGAYPKMRDTDVGNDTISSIEKWED